MKLSEAIAALEQGKKIISGTFQYKKYLRYYQDEDTNYLVDDNGDDYSFDEDDFTRDWKIYEETGPTVLSLRDSIDTLAKFVDNLDRKFKAFQERITRLEQHVDGQIAVQCDIQDAVVGKTITWNCRLEDE